MWPACRAHHARRGMPSLAPLLAAIGIALAFASTAHGQVSWQKNLSNPVIPYGAGGGYALDPVVRFDAAAGVYRMWFTAKPDFGPWCIYAATSTDGLAWYTYVLNPVLEGSAQPFESAGVAYGGVVEDAAGFRMLYVGVSGCCGSAIGLATSPDGVHWAKFAGNPVLGRSPGGWDSAVIRASEVAYFDGSTYSLYYQGSDGQYDQTGLATSIDGVHWTKSPANPVLARGAAGDWDDGVAAATGLFVRDGTYYLLYTGQRIGSPTPAMGLATSSDGVTWTKYAGNPVMSGGTAGNWDWSIHAGCPVARDSTVELWYSGTVANRPEWSIGFATSVLKQAPLTAVPPATRLSFRRSYPNPVTARTTIEFGVPRAARVTLRIFDVHGRMVTQLLDEDQAPGEYRVGWDASAQTSGVYFASLAANGAQQILKVVVVR